MKRMRSSLTTKAAIYLLLVTFSASAKESYHERLLQGLAVLEGCYRDQIERLDDSVSDARVVAISAYKGCETQLLGVFPVTISQQLREQHIDEVAGRVLSMRATKRRE